MYCSQCGVENNGAAKFCTACGASLRNVREGAVEKQPVVSTFDRITQPLVSQKTADFAEELREEARVVPKELLDPASVTDDAIAAYHRHERAKRNRIIVVVAFCCVVVLACLLWFASYKKSVTEKAVEIAQTGDYVLAHAELKKVYTGTDSMMGSCIAFQGTLQNYILNGSVSEFYSAREELRKLWTNVQDHAHSKKGGLRGEEDDIYQLAAHNNRVLEDMTKMFIDSLFFDIDTLREARNYHCSLYLSGKNNETFLVRDVRARFEAYAVVNARAAADLEELTGQIPAESWLKNEDGALVEDENNHLTDLNLPAGETRIAADCVDLVQTEREYREDILKSLAEYSDDDIISYNDDSPKVTFIDIAESISNNHFNYDDEDQFWQSVKNELGSYIAPSFFQERCMFVKYPHW